MAAAVLLGVSASAHALSLGRVTVQSALGEPLRAEIDVSDASPQELESLKTNVASPDAFRAAGMDYSPALTGVRVTLEKRPNGRHVLNLTSNKPVNDPFIDVLLETSWPAGRIVRDFTLLFDPPSMKQSQPLSAQIAPSPATGEGTGARVAAPAPSSASVAARQQGTKPSRPTAPSPSADGSTSSVDGKQVAVHAGDTAGRIAAANKPTGISLDQMLVAMLRANPDAFAGGNVNRLRSGAVLNMPSEQQAAQVPASEATQMLVAQSRDFNEFRRHLAEAVPSTGATGSERQSSGKVSAQVDDRKPTATAPDKLTLSKGGAQGGKAGVGTEDSIARARAAQDSAQRVAELSKNIGDLNRIGGTAAGGKPAMAVPLGSPTTAAAAPTAKGASTPAPVAPAAASAATASALGASAATSASAPLAAAPASAPVMAAPASAAASTATGAASAPIAAASTPVGAASEPLAGASAPAKPAVKPAPVATAKRAPVAPAPTSFLDDLLENPLIPGAAGIAVLGLLGFGAWRFRQRRKGTQVDSSFLESRLQPDSFFGASGGQRIDTNEGTPTGSSMVYSPSQLDAAGDVDPVAEADVYLAYGRDLQAEEILKEALRVNPQRIAIHAKLLDIYAKRRDGRAFETLAAEAHRLTHGEGTEWQHICELGQELDPSNAMYRPGGQPAQGAVTAASNAAVASTAAPALAQPTPASSDIDLDLDFSLGDDPAAAAPASLAAPSAAEPPAAPVHPAAAQPLNGLDLDFGIDAPPPQSTAPGPLELPAIPSEPAHIDRAAAADDDHGLNFELPAMPSMDEPAPAKAAAPRDGGMIEFDLGVLSLELPPGAAATSAAPAAAASEMPSFDLDEVPTGGLSTGGFDPATDDDPLATKLALAQEFNAIGDPDGARSLAQEVIAEASGELKTRAQRFLAEIG